jgi:hypothetical protein
MLDGAGAIVMGRKSFDKNEGVEAVRRSHPWVLLTGATGSEAHLTNPKEIQMPFALPHTQVSRQVTLLLLTLLVVAVLAAVTLGAPGAAHHTLMSPTGCTHGCGPGHVSQA